MSEGRGTTRPFELIGADYVDPFALSAELNGIELPGIKFRPVFFQPTFHKYGGQSIGGTALHVTDRDALDSLRMGLHYLGTVRRLFGDAMAWRTDAYEFVRDRLAIDLLFGCTEARELIDGGARPAQLDQLWRGWQREAVAFEEARRPFLRYS